MDLEKAETVTFVIEPNDLVPVLASLLGRLVGRFGLQETQAIALGLLKVGADEMEALGVDPEPSGRSNLVALVDNMKNDDFVVLCSLTIARVVLDLGGKKAAQFFAAGVANVVATLAAAKATEPAPKD
jgi:hypothetical protein